MLFPFPVALGLRGADLKRGEKAYWEEISSAQFRSVKNPLRKRREARQALKPINLSCVRGPLLARLDHVARLVINANHSIV
jgi:hypothetical protein